MLLAGCVNQSASYYIDGNEHALSLRAQQDTFWSKQVTLRLMVSRLPDCQRQLVLGKAPLSDVEVELFASGEQVYTLRTTEQVWQVDTQGCTQIDPPQGELGQQLGMFRLDGKKNLVFEQAAANAAAK
ncbi:hypothetical protein E4O92_14485 [Massilia horti]|uniref:Uncharacterized protein n=1 Tax=Massilia horti TaxID=2562153 RepID=A0A4Y9SXI6_9BURK|nr:hypothetical protein E4O92_14485 [Massilia horti]